MDQTERGVVSTKAGSGPLVYCVVPPRLARIKPRLCEHFAADPDVEVVIDQRAGERRDARELAKRLVPGLDRRAIDGRRSAVPVENVVSLPPELRRYEKDLTFLAGPVWPAAGNAEPTDAWKRRCITAEQEALALAGTLVAATDALRSRRGLSPRRFRELARAEAALERFRRWHTGADRPA
jgi:hypothetical protein